MSSNEWQCSKCLTYFCCSISECTECNEYDKHGFNGFYCDVSMNIEVYKWIKALEKDLTKAEKLLQDFLTHYKNRKITNGFHDLLAKDINKYFNNKEGK